MLAPNRERSFQNYMESSLHPPAYARDQFWTSLRPAFNNMESGINTSLPMTALTVRLRYHPALIYQKLQDFYKSIRRCRFTICTGDADHCQPCEAGGHKTRRRSRHRLRGAKILQSDVWNGGPFIFRSPTIAAAPLSVHSGWR